MKQAKTWGSATLFFLAMTVLCGVLYTAACTGIAQVAFPHQANGSLIEVDGKVYGSELVAQRFADEDHMWGRLMSPSAGTFVNEEGEDVLWYGPSNLSPASDEFEALVAQRVQQIREAHPDKGDKPIPSDLVTNSGSGFDPHISPAAAAYQVNRLVEHTGKSAEEIRAIIERCTEQPQFGVLGEPRVNVLKVNLMLDGIL